MWGIYIKNSECRIVRDESGKGSYFEATTYIYLFGILIGVFNHKDHRPMMINDNSMNKNQIGFQPNKKSQNKQKNK